MNRFFSPKVLKVPGAGYDSSRPDKKAILPTSSSTHMITFLFENGCVATLRGSGTGYVVFFFDHPCLALTWRYRNQSLSSSTTLSTMVLMRTLTPKLR